MAIHIGSQFFKQHNVDNVSNGYVNQVLGDNDQNRFVIAGLITVNKQLICPFTMDDNSKWYAFNVRENHHYNRFRPHKNRFIIVFQGLDDIMYHKYVDTQQDALTFVLMHQYSDLNQQFLEQYHFQQA